MEPVVLEDVNIVDFVQYILDCHASPTTLIVCSTREAFLQDLLVAIRTSDGKSGTEIEFEHGEIATGDDERSELEQTPHHARRPPDVHPLLLPTLHLLSSSRTVDVAFCPDLTHLLAYLSVLLTRHATISDVPIVSGLHDSNSIRKPLLAILNSIGFHRPTSSFSAQGLNRTIAAAVETAHQLNRRLVIAECIDESSHEAMHDEDGIGVDHEGLEERDRADGTGASTSTSVWDEEVSILNITTKTFGAGQRGWVGRTVTIRRVAERWCRFERLG